MLKCRDLPLRVRVALNRLPKVAAEHVCAVAAEVLLVQIFIRPKCLRWTKHLLVTPPWQNSAWLYAGLRPVRVEPFPSLPALTFHSTSQKRVEPPGTTTLIQNSTSSALPCGQCTHSFSSGRTLKHHMEHTLNTGSKIPKICNGSPPD